MSDSVIDAIRAVDPCPVELAPPPMDIVRRRLVDAPHTGEPAGSRRRPRLSTLVVTVSSVAVVAVAVLAIAILGHRRRVAPTAPATAGMAACHVEARPGVLPVWARAGFSDPRPRMTYALGESGKIAAILWGSLNSPPAVDHTNKILWVSRAAPTSPGSDLRIEAQRMSGTRTLGAPVSRRVTGGPGPSIINLPAPGCWRLTLRWSGRTDHLDLQYGRGAGRAPHA